MKNLNLNKVCFKDILAIVFSFVAICVSIKSCNISNEAIEQTNNVYRTMISIASVQDPEDKSILQCERVKSGVKFFINFRIKNVGQVIANKIKYRQQVNIVLSGKSHDWDVPEGLPKSLAPSQEYYNTLYFTILNDNPNRIDEIIQLYNNDKITALAVMDAKYKDLISDKEYQVDSIFKISKFSAEIERYQVE